MNSTISAVTAAQRKFDETYISSSEICATLGVSRTTINYARRKRMLPEPIIIGPVQVCLWERAVVEPFVKAWRAARTAQGGNLTRGMTEALVA